MIILALEKGIYAWVGANHFRIYSLSYGNLKVIKQQYSGYDLIDHIVIEDIKEFPVLNLLLHGYFLIYNKNSSARINSSSGSSELPLHKDSNYRTEDFELISDIPLRLPEHESESPTKTRIYKRNDKYYSFIAGPIRIFQYFTPTLLYNNREFKALTGRKMDGVKYGRISSEIISALNRYIYLDFRIVTLYYHEYECIPDKEFNFTFYNRNLLTFIGFIAYHPNFEKEFFTLKL